MKHRSLVMMLGLLGLLLLAPAAQAVPPTTPFTGTWIGQDPAPPDGDGSTVHLVITGGSTARITFTDEFGSVCVNEGASETFFRSFLTGKVNGDTLNARFKSAKCGTLVVGFLLGESFSWQYSDNGTANPADDTLWDGSVLWTRDS